MWDCDWLVTLIMYSEGETTEKTQPLLKKKDLLRQRIEQETFLAKLNCKKDRKGALQALRRKKWYEKHVKYIDCTLRAMRSAQEHIEIINKVTDLMSEIIVANLTEDMSVTFNTSLDFRVEFDEGELLGELERLQSTVDEENTAANCPRLTATISEKDDVEAELHYLQCWANEPM